MTCEGDLDAGRQIAAQRGRALVFGEHERSVCCDEEADDKACHDEPYDLVIAATHNGSPHAPVAARARNLSAPVEEEGRLSKASALGLKMGADPAQRWILTHRTHRRF
jgi:hypothetical protein